MTWFYRILIFLAIALPLYFLWSVTGRASENKSGWLSEPKGNIRFKVTGAGPDTFRNNVVGIQPYLTAINYSTAYNLETSLRFYMVQLKKDALLQPRTVVVFPGGIGDGLIVANEKESIFRKENFKAALRTMAVSNFFSFAYHYLQSGAKENAEQLLLRVKAAKMAAQYQTIFSQLAKQGKCTVVAGSVRLPDAMLDEAGNIVVQQQGKMYHTTALFNSSGKIIPPLIKTTSDAAPVIVSTPAGQMLLLHDATDLANQEADFFIMGATRMINAADNAALQKTYAAAPAVPGIPRKGIALFLQAELWDKKPGSNGILFSDSIVLPAAGKGRAGIFELRLR